MDYRKYFVKMHIEQTNILVVATNYLVIQNLMVDTVAVYLIIKEKFIAVGNVDGLMSHDK